MTARPANLADLPAPERVGIVLLTAVGDVVHALPVVSALKRHWPAARLTWVLQPGPATLVDGHPSLDEIIRFDRARGLRGFLDVRRALRDLRFDLVLVLQSYLKAGLIARFARSPITLGYDRARARDGTWLLTTHRIPSHSPQHVQDEYLEFLTALGIGAEPLEWGLGPTEDERAWWNRDFLPQVTRPYAAFVIGTSKPEKDWFADRWAHLADALATDFGLQTVLVGGPSARELATAARIKENAARPPVDALGSGLRRLVAILDGAALVVSPDTGPLHMAVALGRPTIALMGYTNPKRTGPYRRFHELLVDAYGDSGEDYPISHQTRAGHMARIRVDDVLERVDRWKRRYAG